MATGRTAPVKVCRVKSTALTAKLLAAGHRVCKESLQPLQAGGSLTGVTAEKTKGMIDRQWIRRLLEDGEKVVDSTLCPALTRKTICPLNGGRHDLVLRVNSIQPLRIVGVELQPICTVPDQGEHNAKKKGALPFNPAQRLIGLTVLPVHALQPPFGHGGSNTGRIVGQRFDQEISCIFQAVERHGFFRKFTEKMGRGFTVARFSDCSKRKDTGQCPVPVLLLLIEQEKLLLSFKVVGRRSLERLKERLGTVIEPGPHEIKAEFKTEPRSFISTQVFPIAKSRVNVDGLFNLPFSSIEVSECHLYFEGLGIIGKRLAHRFKCLVGSIVEQIIETPTIGLGQRALRFMPAFLGVAGDEPA